MLSHGQDRQDVEPLVDARCPGLGVMGVHDAGAEAAELSGKSIAEIDEAAATGVIPKYQAWQLLVDIDVEPPKKPTKKAAAPKKTTAKR